LESLRGIASVGVLFWHSLLAFFPGRTGILVASDHAWNTQFWFGLVNGPGWVTFFFVLSGFVLTRRCLLDADAAPVVRNALKRWPRLAGPVLLAVLGSWVLYRLALYRFPQAGVLAGSPWLQTGGGMRAPGPANVWEAVRQGVYLTFLRGDVGYDSSLWTMRIEFLGSFIAFGVALLLLGVRGRAARVYVLGVAVLVCHFANPLYVAFPAGVALAAFLPRDWRRLGWPVAAVLLAVGMYLVGYTGVQSGAFRAMGWWWKAGWPGPYANMLGGVLLIVAAESSSKVHAALSRGWGVMLGRLSFPLYLVHVPLICSAGSLAYLGLHPDPSLMWPRLFALVVGAAAAVCAAFPLMWASEAWVRILARLTATAR